jgi:hypothetical protein
MSRPLKFQKNSVGAQSSVNDDERAPEIMSLTAAEASLKCQSALTESPAAARAALAKFRASISSELVHALETVGSYAKSEVSFTEAQGATGSYNTLPCSSQVLNI